MKTRNITNVLMVAVVAATLGMGVVQPAAAAWAVYDFENLNGSPAGIEIVGQDGWTDQAASTVPAVVRNDTTGFSGASGNYVFSSGTPQLIRKNDANFSFVLSDGRPFEIIFKARASGANTLMSWVALWADADDNGALDAGEIGPTMGYMNGNLSIRGADHGTVVNVATPGQNTAGYEVKVVIDPTANAGDGSGRLYYRIAGTSNPWTDTGTDVNLQIKRMSDAVQALSTWNGLYIRLSVVGAGQGGGIDDITIYQEQPPQGTLFIIK